MEIPTFIVVYGTIPRFTQTSQSYLKLKTLFDALMQFDIEILFKPEQPNGNWVINVYFVVFITKCIAYNTLLFSEIQISESVLYFNR